MELEPVLWDSDLEDFLENAVQPQENERTHVIIGDSIAKRAPGLGVAAPNLLLRLDETGHSWRRLATEVKQDIILWQQAAEAYGPPVGTAIIWMTGNDLYPRHGHLISGLNLEQLWSDVAEVVTALRPIAEDVVILGPLPRFKFDVDKVWSTTPAYLGERCIRKCMEDLTGTSNNVINLGRTLTETRGKVKAVVPGVRRHFSKDKIHLSASGYSKVLDKVPSWLTQAPEEEDI